MKTHLSGNWIDPGTDAFVLGFAEKGSRIKKLDSGIAGSRMQVGP